MMSSLDEGAGPSKKKNYCTKTGVGRTNFGAYCLKMMNCWKPIKKNHTHYGKSSGWKTTNLTLSQRSEGTITPMLRGCELRVAGWKLRVKYLLLDTRCSLLPTARLLLTAYCSLFTRGLLLTPYFLPFTFYLLLFLFHCLLLTDLRPPTSDLCLPTLSWPLRKHHPQGPTPFRQSNNDSP